ncbi:MAG: sulfite exporter TauE/SafE family protein [Oscillospiraceae bacterium]
MDIIIFFIAIFFSAAIGSMGIGGGAILLIYLSAFMGVAQRTAQGINLLFFIPVAILALILHTKSKLISWKITMYTFIPGIIGAFIGYYFCSLCEQNILKKLFALFLLLIGIKELFFTKKIKE